ncbi:hypothetical protein RZS08_09680, partial [Arthrospira platensis SPKY1]|nr:hypothetical protein [Arthrospira platensis SPKY1]
MTKLENNRCVAYYKFVGGGTYTIGDNNKFYGGGLSKLDQGQGTKFPTSNVFQTPSRVAGKKIIDVEFD